MRFLLRPSMLLSALLLGVLATSARSDDKAPYEPRPPWIFFPEPDAKTAAEIDALVTNSFGDLSQIVAARDQLVRRYGVVSVPRLALELRRAVRVNAVLGCELTVWALRDRVGPARELWPLLEPLVALLRDSGGDPYLRAFAALALGSFHQTVGWDRDLPSVAFVTDRALLARQTLGDAGRLLAAGANEEKHQDVRASFVLALAKRGPDPDGDARRVLLSDGLWKPGIGVPPRQAVLLALGLLPGPGDDERFLAALKDGEGRIRRAAALGLALQLVQDRPAVWAPQAARIVKALKQDPIRPDLADGFEAVFTRGILAARAGVAEEWDLLRQIAIDPESKTEAAAAAAQCLLFAPEPWVSQRAIGHLQGTVALPDPVVAAFLLLAGRSGTPDGIAVCRDYLGSKSKRPAAHEAWDVRFHAAIGILRALASGALRDPQTRREAVDALEAGVRRSLDSEEMRTRIDRVLEKSRSVLRDPLALLPDAEVRYVEEGFSCPYGLLSHELEDMVLFRLNDLLPDLYNIRPTKGKPGEPDKTQVPQRLLQACLERYPYFRRIELLETRGLRPPSIMQGAADPALEVRNPP